MNEDRQDLNRVEEMVLRVNKRHHLIERRLDALEQAVIELSITLSRLGEAISPNKEPDPSDAPTWH